MRRISVAPRLLRPCVVAATALALSGCVYADAGVTTFSVETVPVTDRTLSDRVLPDRAAPDRAAPDRAGSLQPSGPEIRYARDSVRAVFRRRDGERSQSFLSDYPDGYALCIRSAGQYALIVFQRRIFESQISQAADDTVILRAPGETAACRPRDDWTKA